MGLAFATAQEDFWAGTFGDDYIPRNTGPELIAARLAIWSRILSRAGRIDSVTELGANIGLNLEALRRLLPGARLTGVEINARAAAQLRLLSDVDVVEGSLLDVSPVAPADLAFTAGVLIHIAPERLNDAYDRLAAAAARFVVISEYYNPSPVAIPYRGHDDKLFKRDFAGEFLDRHPTFELLDYGFVYRRDPVFPADDTTWFLMQRRTAPR